MTASSWWPAARAPSPFARSFDPYRLPRIQAVEIELAHWLNYFERNPQERYVSDGDPAVITVAPAPSTRCGDPRERKWWSGSRREGYL